MRTSESGAASRPAPRRVRIRGGLAGFALAALLAACGDPAPTASGPAAPTAEPASSAPSPAEALRTLLDAQWQRRLSDSPILATYLGDARYNDRWDDLRPQAIAERKAADRTALEQLGAIDRAVLPPAEQLNYDLFKRDLEDRIEGQAFKPELTPLHPLDGVQLLPQIVEFTPLATVQDYRNWLARLQGVEALVDQTVALMRTGISEKRLWPRVAMQRVLPQIAAQLASKAEDSAFYAPFKRMPESVDAALRQQLEIGAQSVIVESIIPAYRRLYEFVEREYLPACPEHEYGISAQPQGEAYYAWLVRRHTTTRMTPDQVHELGLREVARIRGEMTELMRKAGHTGSIARFREKLGWNPRYTYTEAGALLDAYRAVAKRIDPELPRLFGKLPRTPYGVRPIPEVAAPSAPAAYYYPPSADGSRAGYFYANTHRPQTRFGWEIEALTAHEAVPGHHLQIALANELEGLPEFRRQGLELTAFVEGWGLYAESLGHELGLYQDAGSRFGQLSFEMWRAVRLVVDTGLHAKGWSRKKAREYAADLVPKGDDEIAVEIDRYLVMPGQALAYKVGELRIKDLRRRAQAQLGARFDVRGFHDTVLGNGALPLDLLERNVDAWIAAQEAAKDAAK